MSRISKRASQIAPSLTLAISAKAAKLKAEGVDVVSFAAGEPDFNTPDYICTAAKTALDKGQTRYTAVAGTIELRKAVAVAFLKDHNLAYEPNQIVVSNGAKHSLFNAFAAILEKGDEVLLPSPFWLTYPEVVIMNDGVPKIIETTAAADFKITPAQLKKAITKKTKAIILNNPSNPTGTVYSKEEICALAEILEKTDIIVVSDEIYEKLIYDGQKAYSIASYSPKMKENTIIINGLSKTYAMTGWRIGYTASSKDIAAAMDSLQSHATSNANSIAQAASVAALTDSEGEKFLTELSGTFEKRRDLAVRLLEDMKPLTFVRPQGAFYVMVGMDALKGKVYEGKTITGAADFAELLIDYAKVVAIPCESFGAGSYIRLSYATSEEQLEKGLNRIKEFVAKL